MVNLGALDRLAPYALTLLRLGVAAVFLAHGLPKMGFVDGFGGMLGAMGVPAPSLAAIGIIALEIVGGGALILGLGTRIVGLLLALQMVVTTFVVKWPMTGFVAPPGQGVGAELDLLLLLAALILVTHGAGALAADGFISRLLPTRPAR